MLVEEVKMEVYQRRMEASMQLPRLHRDTVQKLVTWICVEASDVEWEMMIRGSNATAEEVIAWERAEGTSPSLKQHAN